MKEYRRMDYKICIEYIYLGYKKSIIYLKIDPKGMSRKVAIGRRNRFHTSPFKK